MPERLELAKVIAALREELDEAMKAAAGKLVRFQLGAVDLEFQVEVAREGGINGKVKFWVIEVGAEGTLSSASTQVVKVHLDPKDALTGGPILVAGDSAAPVNMPPLPPAPGD
jgi:hypothetical protein